MDLISRLAVRTVSYKSGRFLFLTNEDGANICFMLSGAARVFRMTEGGDEVTIAVRSCQSTPILLSACIKGVGIELLEDSVLCFKATDDYIKASSDDIELRQYTIAQFMEFFECCHQRIEDLVLRSVEERVARQLVLLAERPSELQSKSSATVRITQGQLASLVAASRPSVNIALRKLQQRGILTTTSGFIKIASIDKLRNMSAVSL
ncbi:hypothetical protein RA27_15325 [Ruegeria sp. ANG-R]|uniref:Crp/Fnr family transcriptional regulator n=1 Tax=Ruegeria sp. ANG-R TaxID=1577903 RepID=UPI00057E4A81|nr:Crp/Fnr family transcriptional regulator [Ruegeria sp. ANG-R]KIC40194.1 hypothetical protein RA27_15325 [Ruegeria sp. ANG-R]